MDRWGAIAGERRALADVLDTLTPEQWATQSLCGVWTVHGVVAHLVTPLSMRPVGVASALARSGGRVSRVMEVLAEQRQRREPAELVGILRARAGLRFAPPVVGSVGPLTDVMVHRRDIFHPLGLTDDRPAELWEPVLDFLVSPRSRIGFRVAPLPRLRLVATDVSWSHGDGAEVVAPAAALACALLRRTPWLGELSGPGAEDLRAWARAE